MKPTKNYSILNQSEIEDLKKFGCLRINGQPYYWNNNTTYKTIKAANVDYYSIQKSFIVKFGIEQEHTFDIFIVKLKSQYAILVNRLFS